MLHVYCVRDQQLNLQDLVTTKQVIGVFFSGKSFVQKIKFKMPKDRLQALKQVSYSSKLIIKFISCDLLNHVTSVLIQITSGFDTTCLKVETKKN